MVREKEDLMLVEHKVKNVTKMTEAKQYIQTLFSQKNISVSSNRIGMFEEYVKQELNVHAVRQIQDHQKMLMANWELQLRIRDIIEAQMVIPNGTVGRPYATTLDFIKIGMNDLIYTDFEGLDQLGLVYDNEAESITGTPTLSGDFKIIMKFRITGEEETKEPNEKKISLIINADPKTLWKSIPSESKDDNFWKPDDVSDFQKLGEKSIVVASKRGRSHANVGSFRDDDFAFKYFSNTGWSIVCVADGAGSATLSRQGSKIACESVVNFFSENFTKEALSDFDSILLSHHQNATDETSKSISHFVYNNLSKAAVFAHKQIENFSIKNEKQLNDFHTTLIFGLYKKYDFGTAILTFGVGDCPIGLLNTDLTEVKLMNWLDVGEFGGGTRFITMPEIFVSEKFSTRFGFKLIDDFSYLILMTDGIYDPKFVVEANLEKIEKWKEFLDDLQGKNDDTVKVEFSHENTEIANELSLWMDFWSPGNHDDRTLAIVF